MATAKPREIPLPPPTQRGKMSLEEALALRKSVRDFAPHPLTKLQLSCLLWAVQGVSNASWQTRTVPSAGATYPLDVFIVCGENGIEEVAGGVYQYRPDAHSLILHYIEDVRRELAGAALNQDFIWEAPLDIVICAICERTTGRYGTRGERYVHMEVGHAGQNLYLEATSLGLGTVAIGAFHDDAVREALRLDRRCRPLYIMPVGRPRTR